MIIMDWQLLITQLLKMFCTLVLGLGIFGVIKNPSIGLKMGLFLDTALITSIFFIWF